MNERMNKTSLAEHNNITAASPLSIKTTENHWDGKLYIRRSEDVTRLKRVHTVATNRFTNHITNVH